jgi:hypothetical protein
MPTLETTQIHLPYPEGETANLHLWIKVAGARFYAHPDEGSSWVNGVYHDPSQSIPCHITREGGSAWIIQDQNPFNFFSMFNGIPDFDLALGQGNPFHLTLEAAASDKQLELGGIPLTRLEVKQGAGKMNLTFSAPNPAAMTMLHLGTGAGKIEAKGLLNANFNELSVDSGAGTLELDFGGTLQHDAHARISAGMGTVELHLPAAIPARIYSDSAMVNVDADNGFSRQARAFLTPAALTVSSPMLSIQTSVGVGTLRLRLF